MSTLQVNTLRDASAGNPMGVANVNQGRAKAWANLNETGVAALHDSFNISGVIDNAAGNFSYTLATPTATNKNNMVGMSGDVGTLYTVSSVFSNMTVSNFQIVTSTTSTGTATDIVSVASALFGDT